MQVMNTTILIDAIVKETTALVAQLATTAGARAPLAHVAEQVFVHLAAELEAQGVAKKVAADMFGMVLRTYQRKLRRLTESGTERGVTLWEAIYGWLTQHGEAERVEVMTRFRRDDEAMVAGILRDLVQSGVVIETRQGPRISYRVAAADDLAAAAGRERSGRADLAWAVIYTGAASTLETLAATLDFEPTEVDAVVVDLVEQGRIRRNGDALSCERFVLNTSPGAGWEAAVYEHFHSMVQTIIRRLGVPEPDHRYPDASGGSTYTFDIWPGHPYEAEVTAKLSEMRRGLTDLRSRVMSHNDEHGRRPGYARAVIYAGQHIIDPAPSSAEETP